VIQINERIEHLVVGGTMVIKRFKDSDMGRAGKERDT